MGSAFYNDLLSRAAHTYTSDPIVRELLDSCAHLFRPGLRLGGALHFRALRGAAPDLAAHLPSTGGDGNSIAAWRAAVADIHAHSAQYAELLERHVQTNEVARSLPILASMLATSRQTRMPLRVFEIGASAGINLNFDRYGYAGDGWSWGEPDSPLQLRNTVLEGQPRDLDAPLQIVERRGCDPHPLDVANPVDADTLLGFVWPDQIHRIERLRSAIEIARRYPVMIEAADGIDWIDRAVCPQPGAATAIMHTVIFEHMSAGEREALRRAIAQTGESASPESPVAWVRMEPGEGGAYETRVTVWPGANEVFLARSDGHAQSLRWNVQAA